MRSVLVILFLIILNSLIGQQDYKSFRDSCLKKETDPGAFITVDQLQIICKKHRFKFNELDYAFTEEGFYAIYRRAYVFNSSCTIDHFIDLTTGEVIRRGRICRTF
ncbi:MAG: hypothetical protein H6599_11965 [Flavobacteriales bacterium]|nr:hypothetical protein [Flavobacteriales bacterium]